MYVVSTVQSSTKGTANCDSEWTTAKLIDAINAGRSGPPTVRKTAPNGEHPDT